MTPDVKSFVGGIYFSALDRYGQPGFTKVLERIPAAWKQGHEKIAEQGSKIVEALRESQNAQPEAAAKIDNQLFQTAYEQLSRSFDDTEGGFGTTPKFPPPLALT